MSLATNPMWFKVQIEPLVHLQGQRMSSEKRSASCASYGFGHYKQKLYFYNMKKSGLLTQWQSTRLLTDKFWVQAPGNPFLERNLNTRYNFFQGLRSPNGLRNKNKTRKKLLLFIQCNLAPTMARTQCGQKAFQDFKTSLFDNWQALTTYRGWPQSFVYSNNASVQYWH